MPRRLVGTFLAALAIAAAADAGRPVDAQALVIGIGDQKASTFSDPLFRSLGVRRTRYFPAWDDIFNQPEVLDAWMAAARGAGTEPLIAFRAARGSKCPRRPCRLPSVRSYTRAFRAFRARSWNGVAQELTEKEAMILKVLAERPGEIVSREDLLERVWGYDVFPSTRTVDNFILRLRKRFEQDPAQPKHFLTVWGVVYRFLIEGEA